MARYVLASIVRGVLTLVAVSVIVFVLARISGDPIAVLTPRDMSAEDKAAVAAEWGLDKSVPEQYATFVERAVRGDFGQSFTVDQSSATDVIWSRLPATLRLAGVALLLIVVIGVPLGVLAAVKRGSFMDRAARAVALVGQSIPEFWLGLVAIWIFAVQLRWLPTSGDSGPANYILPSVVVALFGIAAILRLFRSGMLETLRAEYIKLARLQGISRARIEWRHAFKPALIAPLTIFGQLFVHLIIGATIVEIVFNWPGIGLLAFNAASGRDFPVVQAIALLTASVIVVTNISIDLIYAWIDPRVRLGQKAMS
jgi:peptide/nickel transport system permease protein